MHEMRRARPWLGTFVEIRVAGLANADALAAIDAAFAEVAEVHRLMSFHEPASDLSRLHRAAASAPVRVDARTFAVLEAALCLAAESDGRFDPTIAAQLVAWDFLPAPASSPSPDAQATWRDIELLDGSLVRFQRPLWLDLGGIAKGYAVDRALGVLRQRGAVAACVNAGGDLRCFGAQSERVELRFALAPDVALPVVELADAAVATSAVDAASHRVGGRRRGGHLNARTRRTIRAHRAVSVVAPTCLIADALTKVVLADARVGERLLRRHAASACLHDAKRGWRMLGCT
ncbi:FAD:protein FMN transferase [Dokdonella soli]|uniref:FAD:protein FMN transferase n=1 Tax=Dokdonella soli TaxID=529810 RepID=A0ABP3TN85_9GAMM